MSAKKKEMQTINWKKLILMGEIIHLHRKNNSPKSEKMPTENWKKIHLNLPRTEVHIRHISGLTFSSEEANSITSKKC